MKNTVGHLALKDNFYYRPEIIRQIYRRLEAKDCPFLAAPRRMGKSSIMQYLSDNPQKNYSFVYVDVESVSNTQLFFEYLAKALLKSKQIGGWAKMTNKTWQAFLDLADKINKVVVFDNHIDVSASENRYYQAFMKLLEGLQHPDKKVILMVDELPQAITHIHHHQDKEQANVFLHLLRQIRLESPTNVGFIYTGSIGLNATVKKVTDEPVINDIESLTIPPFKRSEALDLCQRILTYYQVPFEETGLVYLLDKMQHYLPYHLQLLLSQLIDLSDSLDMPVDTNMIDTAFLQLLRPEHDKVFRHYYNRLKTIFSKKERKFILCLLEHIAENKEITKTTARGLAAKFNCQKHLNLLLETLQYDGYIYADEEGNYRFISLLLLEWWRKYVLNW